MESVRVILQALNSGDVALAKRTVDAEVAKSPQSDVYLSLKVYVSHSLLDRATALATAAEAVKVCSKKTLEMFLIPVLVDYHAFDLLMLAFQRVDRLMPHDAEVREAWLESAIQLGDLSSAQKALMALQRDAKNSRGNVFEACIVMALIDPPNKLFPMLASRMIEPVLPATNPQECYVVAMVRKMTSTANMVAYLQNPELQAFLDGSLELQLMLLNGLLELEQWDQLFAYATSQLTKIDSYNYWEALNTAAVHSNQVKEAAEFRTKFNGLNARLAAIDLASKAGEPIDEPIKKYWEDFSTNSSTAKFLKPYATAAVFEQLPQATLGAKLNAIKLQGQQKSVSDLISLYDAHKGEAPQEKTEYFIGTDALLMAASMVSRESAIVLMEYALNLDPHNFYVRLMLIELYTSLGLTSLARPHFDSLSIKNIQYETLGFLLTTRIGTVSPQETKHIMDRQETVRRRMPNFGVYGVSALQTGAYTQFEGVFRLGCKINRSLGHALQLLESVKASRCTRGEINMDGVVGIAEPESLLMDSRDFTTRFSGISSYTVGPVQKNQYVAVQRAKELAITEYTTGKTGVISSELADLAEKSAEFTEVEKWNVRAITSLLTNEKVPSAPEFDTTLPLDWQFYHWAYTLLETAKVAKLLRRPTPPVHSLVLQAAQTYMSGLIEAERSFVANTRDVPGDHSRYARNIRNEHSRKLQALQALL